MTTLCLCDWVETSVDRERRLAADPSAGAPDLPMISRSAAGRAMPPLDGRQPSTDGPTTTAGLPPMSAIAMLLVGVWQSSPP